MAPEQGQPHQGGGNGWRRGVLAALLLVGMVAGLVPLAMGAYSAWLAGAYLLALLDVAFYLAVVALYFLPGLSFLARALGASMLLYLAGVAIIAVLGPFSGGPAYLFTFCVFTGVLLGVRFGLAALALNTATMLALAVMIGQGYFPEVAATMGPPTRWLTSGFNFVFLNVVVTVLVSLLVRGLERALSLERASRGELEREMALRAEAERDLAEREQWYRTTFEFTGTGMLLSGEDTTIQMANQGLAKLTGFSTQELTGKSWRDLVHPDDLERMASFHSQRRQGAQAPTSYEFRLINKDGDLRLVFNTVQLIPGTGMSVASLIDVTERRLYEHNLAASQARYKTLLAAIPDPVVVYSRDGLVDYVNTAFIDTYGWTLEEIKGRRLDFVPPEEEQVTADAWTDQVRGVGAQFETRRLTKDGRTIEVEVCAATLTGDEGEYDGALVIHRDITNRKAAEEALKVSEQKFATAFHQSPVWVVLSTLEEGRFLDVNQAFLEVTGYARDELIGMTTAELDLWVDPGKRAQAVAQIKAKGSVSNLGVQFRTKQGRILDVLFAGGRIQYGGHDCLVGVAQDITDLKRVERRFRRSEEQFRTAFKSAPTGMALIGMDRKLIKVNRRFCEMLGYDEEELVGMDFNQLTHPEDREAGAERFRLFEAGREERTQVEKRYLHKNGEVVWVLVGTSLVRDEAGRPSHVVCHLLDITQRRQAEQARLESERRFRQAFQTIPDAITINRLSDSVYVSANQGFAEMSGYREEEVVGRTTIDMDIWVDAGDRERLRGELARKGVVQNMEMLFRIKDGTQRTCLISAAIITLEGEPHILSITRDVDDWKRAELAVRESEERAKATLAASPDPMVVYDGQGRATYINPAFTRVFGWEMEELRGKRVPFVPGPEQELTARMVHMCLDQDQPLSFVSRRLTKEGGLVDVVISAMRMIDHSGDIAGMVVNLTDITERRDMERALEESEKRYRDLVDNITDFIYTHDLDGRILSINRAACQTLGYRPEELIGNSITSIMLPEHHQSFHDKYLLRLREAGSLQGMSVYLDHDGGRHYLEYRSELVRGSGHAPYVRGSAREVSERIKAEREQRKLEEQLFQAQKMEALATLTGGVAHDFNNLLMAIIGSLNLAGSKLDRDHPSQQHLTSAVAAAQRAAMVTRQLLTTARRAERRVQPVRLGALVRDTVGLLAETIDRRIQVQVEVAPDLHWVTADEAQISQVIMNLAVNSRDAVLQALAGQTEAGDEPHIRITARNATVPAGDKLPSALAYPGEFVEICVADTGCGMDAEVVERIYEPFFTTKPAAEGTGLGLATVYGIVEQHRGWLEVESAPGHGTKFKVFLPASIPESEEDMEEVADSHAATGDECILVVDDESQILDVVSEALESLGYRVVTAANGEEALTAYQENAQEIKLILLDLTMPKMSGREVAKRVLAQNPEARIIISSGEVVDRDWPELNEGRRLDFLYKPYNLSELASRVRAMLDS